MKLIREIFTYILENIRADLDEIKGLEKNKRAAFIWDYHKWKIIIGAAVVLCGLGLIFQAVFHKETALKIAIVNAGTDFERDKKSEKRIAEFLGINQNKQQVLADSSYQIIWEENEKADYADYDKFFLNLSAGEIDVAVLPTDFLDYCQELEPVMRELKYFGELGEDKERFYSFKGRFIGVYADRDKKYAVCFPETNKENLYVKKLARALIEGSEDIGFLLAL